MQEIIVEKRTVYGNDLIYPVCDKARAFARIAGTTTLSWRVIRDIKELGYKLTTKQEEI